MTPDRVTVTFHAYCPLHEEAIIRHTDTYRCGQYRAHSLFENGRKERC
jgi:hypothetical protein